MIQPTAVHFTWTALTLGSVGATRKAEAYMQLAFTFTFTSQAAPPSPVLYFSNIQTRHVGTGGWFLKHLSPFLTVLSRCPPSGKSDSGGNSLKRLENPSFGGGGVAGQSEISYGKVKVLYLRYSCNGRMPKLATYKKCIKAGGGSSAFFQKRCPRRNTLRGAWGGGGWTWRKFHVTPSSTRPRLSPKVKHP